MPDTVTILTLMTASLSYLTANIWTETLVSAIDHYFPNRNKALMTKFVFSIFLTIGTIFALIFLERILEHVKPLSDLKFVPS